jgi:hypothetical protein
MCEASVREVRNVYRSVVSECAGKLQFGIPVKNIINV